MIVVLNAKFARLLAVHASKNDGEKRRSPTTVPCFASSNTLMFNFYRSLDCACENESIIYFPTIYGRKKHPFTGYPAAMHPNHSKFAITDMREKPANLFSCSTRASTLVSAITLLTQVPVQKFPFLFMFIIP